MLGQARLGHLEVVRCLLDTGATADGPSFPHWTPLEAAVEGGHSSVVNLLLEHGADPDPPGINGSPLVNAFHHPTIIRALAERGANINATDSFGSTALINAASEGELESVKTLLELGADPTRIDEEGASAWGCAIEEEYPEIAKLFPVKARSPNRDSND